MDRIIFHVDVNSAFLSWTAVRRLREDPGALDLRTVPSAVGGDIKTRHGVITAKSIPAKAFGVQTGEPVVTALKKCPGLIVVPSEFDTYRASSRQFMRILTRYTAAAAGVPENEAPVEQVSIDESFADMTGIPDPLSYAAKLREEVRETLGFTVNVGISSNKLLAKMASDFEKPDKTHTLWPSEIPDKLWPLPIRDLFGCGRATAERLRSFGIRTIGDAARTDLAVLKAILGDKGGAYIHRAANGIGSVRVAPREEDAKSYSNETTTAEDITAQNSAEALPPVLKRLSNKVASRLRRDGFRASTIGIMVKTGEFQRHSRQTTLLTATNDPDEIQNTADRLMHALLYEEETGLFHTGQVLRLVGVSAAGLTKETEEYRQMSLFELPEIHEDNVPPETHRNGSVPVPEGEPGLAHEPAPGSAPESAAEPAPESEAAPEPAAAHGPAPGSAGSSAASEDRKTKKAAALSAMLDKVSRRYGTDKLKKGSTAFRKGAGHEGS